MSKIAVLDSGFGGLTVLKELLKAMPNEDYVYHGDSANAPYGDKKPDELCRLNANICSALLKNNDIKCFVVACNTTTSDALDDVRAMFPGYDFIGIEPALTWAAEENPGRNILVLATTATIKGRRIKMRIEELKGKGTIVLREDVSGDAASCAVTAAPEKAASCAVPAAPEKAALCAGKAVPEKAASEAAVSQEAAACAPPAGKAVVSLLAAPGIVPFVEKQQTGEEAFKDYLKELLKDYKTETDCVVLGCTHFPFVKDEIRDCFDKDVKFYDAAVLIAEEVKALLTEKGCLNSEEHGPGSIEYLNSDPSKTDTERRLLEEYKG